MSTWSEVQRGFVVEDKTGRHWTITDRQGKIFSMSSPGKPVHTGEFSGDVKIISRPAPQDDPNVQMAVAAGLVATKLGGVEIGKRGKGNGPWYQPVEYVDPGSLLAHLRIFHNAMSDEPGLAGLTAVHVALHGPDQKTADHYEPHIHTPDYEDR